MKGIQIALLNYNPQLSRDMVSFGARMSKSGSKIKTVEDILNFGLKSMSDKAMDRLVNLPHGSLHRLDLITVVLLGVSRRFLAKITRHHEAHFMASSFTFEDVSATADYVMPIEVMRCPAVQEDYNDSVLLSIDNYKDMVDRVGHDAAAYLLPQATRCNLIVSASSDQWRHMIRTRTCRRNSSEMRIVMLRLWHLLHQADPIMWQGYVTGPACCSAQCGENPACGESYYSGQDTPIQILEREYPEIAELEKTPGKVLTEGVDEVQKV